MVEPGQPHVENSQHAVGAQQQITRLDVAMDHSLPVSVSQGAGGLQNQIARRAEPKRAVPANDCRQVASFDEFHRQVPNAVLDAGIEGAHDVRMIELGRRLHFALKATDGRLVLGQRGRQQLDRHHAVHVAMPRLEHLSHAARADLFQQIVVAE